MPRLALISPRGADFARNKTLADFLTSEPKMKNIRSMWSSPNLGLLTVAALTPGDWDIEYIDEHQKPINFASNYDIVGVSCMTQQVERGYEILRKFKEKGITTVIGGIHATVRPDEVAGHADTVIVGEAELTWPRFLRDWSAGSPEKMYTEDRPGKLDMNLSPVPRYELVKDYNYTTITVHTSRGCPHDCSFCAASRVYGPLFRRKSNEQIINELILIKKEFPGKYVLFGDDNIFVSRRESKELLKEMRKIGLHWVAQTDISIATDDELLRLMAEGGCHWVVIGLESIAPKSLENVNMWKVARVAHYRDYVARIQKYGIGVMGAFVFGLDYDDFSVMQDTIDFINECNLYGIHVTSPTPFPGTRFRKQMESERRLIDMPWSYYTHWDVLIKPRLMSPEELHDCIYKIYQSFVSEEDTKKRFVNFIHQQRKNLIQNVRK